MTDGEFRLLAPQDPALWAFLRQGPESTLLVAANCSSGAIEVVLPLGDEWAGAAVVLSNLDGPAPGLLPRLRLRPWESVVWRLADGPGRHSLHRLQGVAEG